MEASSQPVAIIGGDGTSIGTGWLERSDGSRDLRLRAPLWMLCLDGNAGIRLQTSDGTAFRFRVREVVAMDGTMATVRVETSDGGVLAVLDRQLGHPATA